MPALGLALVATLALLLAHAWAYRFLTDDAYISFRYARNFANGFGLVFNPGGGRVEGYSDFLWVLLLAALDRLGIAPERAAVPLGLAFTVALWGVVTWFACRVGERRRRPWTVVLPLLLLAATRSVAVWSTSGLETRLFELLVVGGALRLTIEIEAQRAGAPVRALAPWLFALASLTRPDGLLLSLVAFAASAVLVGRARPGAVLRLAWGWMPFALLLGAHFAFRRLYYHAWLPNTYYAKVGGRLWWDSGWRYAESFVLEYGAYLWAPLLVAAILEHRARRTAWIPLLFAALIVPHFLFVVAIGGDHFEYRPFDLYFPLVFLMLADGARRWARGVARTSAVAAGIALMLVGLIEIPWQSHRQFPPWYMAGFPGEMHMEERAAREFLDPDRDPVYRWPGASAVARCHRDLLRRLTAQFVGIRQEEHRRFLETALDQGRRLRRVIDAGLFPADVRIAMDCVGAIPYVSGVYTLDRLGLTDAEVARSPFVQRIMAHGKYATLEQARRTSVDLWPIDPVNTLCPFTSVRLLDYLARARASPAAAESVADVYAAYTGEDRLLVCKLPLGLERARARFPRLEFWSFADPTFQRAFIAGAIPMYFDSLRAEPGNFGLAYRLAYLCLLDRRYAAARILYERLAAARPQDLVIERNLAICEHGLGARPRRKPRVRAGVRAVPRPSRFV